MKNVRRNKNKNINPKQVNPNNLAKAETKFTIPIRTYTEEILKKIIIGQDDFIKKVTTAIYRRLLFNISGNILIVGGSGSGKTETLKCLAEILDIPYTIESATEYTQSGYVGNDIEDIVDNLYKNAKSRGKLNKLEMAGIVIMDEIDKKAENTKGSVGGDVAGKAVQQRLLKFMDGMPCETYDEEDGYIVRIHTENLIFICIGAFEGLDEIRKERLNNKNIGFHVQKKDESDKQYTEADFIKYGMIKEFMGRFDCIAETNKLSIADFEKIIETSHISAFKKYKEILKEQNIEVEYSEKLISNIAKKAHKMNVGARAIKSVVNTIFENILCDIMDNPDKKYSICRLNDDIAYDNTMYVLE